MNKFTVTITLKDKGDSEDGVDISANIAPLPTDEEMDSSPSIQMLHEFLKSLDDQGEVQSAHASINRGDECLYEKELKP